MENRKSLLDQIEERALDEDQSVTGALRRCLALGGRAGSSELIRWAERELEGYKGEVEVPDYRTVFAPLVIDGISGPHAIERQQISPIDLPDVAQEAGVDEDVTLRGPIGELEELSRRGTDKEQGVRISVPGGATLAKIMTAEMKDPTRFVHRIYWNVSPTSIYGVVDQVRTTLVRFVAELRGQAGDDAAPTGEEVTSALNSIVVYKSKGAQVVLDTSTGDGGTTILEQSGEDRPWWKRRGGILALIGTAATVALAVIAYLTYIR